MLITIKNGELDIDMQGYVGMECARDTILKKLKELGNITSLRRKNDERPVHDNSIIDIN
jgi:hypothetical protein